MIYPLTFYIVKTIQNCNICNLPSYTSTSHKVSAVFCSKRMTRYLPVLPHWNACVSPSPTGLSWQAHTRMLWTVGAVLLGLTSVVPMRIMESLSSENDSLCRPLCLLKCFMHQSHLQNNTALFLIEYFIR